MSSTRINISLPVEVVEEKKEEDLYWARVELDTRKREQKMLAQLRLSVVCVFLFFVLVYVLQRTLSNSAKKIP